MRVSVVIRTYNEERYLGSLLKAIAEQRVADDVEVLVVDSGSTDNTLKIAAGFGARIVHIEKAAFSFGRSLNEGVSAAHGDVLVFVSGHCVPVNAEWLDRLVAPIRRNEVAMTYGRQVGGPATRFSETQIFEKFYPSVSSVPQTGFFANNANSALSREAWNMVHFDEDLPGLEDMRLAKDLVERGQRIGYVAEAVVFHYHHETWPAIRRRYEREAIALRHIRPDLHFSFGDFVKFFVSSVVHDVATLVRRGMSATRVGEIAVFRLMQFWGTYRGNQSQREISAQEKELYFYPRNQSNSVIELGRPGTYSSPRINESGTNSRAATHEGPQRESKREEFSDFRR